MIPCRRTGPNEELSAAVGSRFVQEHSACPVDAVTAGQPEPELRIFVGHKTLSHLLVDPSAEYWQTLTIPL